MNQRILPALLLAVFALPALAQSQVRISGRVASGFESYRLSGSPTANLNGSGTMVSDNSSRLIFSGSEDLGGGLKAFFQIDNRFRTDDAVGAGIGTGNTGVGLEGHFGRVTLGRWDLHYNEGTSLERQKALSDQTWATQGLLSQVNGNVIARVSRSNNVIKYDTPNLNGLNATIAYSSNPAGSDGNVQADADKDGAYQVAARYQNGPFDAGISFWHYNVEGVTNNGDQRAARGWFGYRSGGWQIGVVIDQSKRRPAANANLVRRTAWALPVSYVTGPHAFHFHYARAGSLGNTPNTSARQWLLGYEYALSKRTTLGVNYVTVKNDSAATYDFKGVAAGFDTAAGQDARQFYLGMRHDF